jgi:peptidoglycan/LPS O-acetylase OafA/YrhL
LKYRREIDGLRAVAVLPVMLFHAGIPGFSGGYVGVDVFFVISGFLITRIIADDLENGTFSMRSFYERRARRILPVLFFVMAACVPFVWLWFTPADAKAFGHSLIATTLFSSNILFWSETGYFATLAELKPLLHTWSLAVEEQFYLLYPLVLAFVWRWHAQRRVALLGLGAFGSLALAHWATMATPAAGFYLAPTRAWELLIGSLLALSQLDIRYRGTRPLLDQLGSGIGLALIVGSIILFDEGTAFPGVPALAPTLGAALILAAATPATLVGKLLGGTPCVGIGLISYSAYLWHQPLFAFARHRSLAVPGPSIYAALSVLTLALAYVTWRFVESPLRDRSRIATNTLVRGTVWVGAGLLVLGLAGSATGGAALSRHDPGDISDIEARLRANQGISELCDNSVFDPQTCGNSDNPEVLLWGDSFAMHLWQGLAQDSTLGGIAQATQSRCGPIVGVAPLRGNAQQWAEGCLRHNDSVFSYLVRSPHVKYVVVSSPFNVYVDNETMLLLRDGRRMLAVDTARAAFRETLSRIQALGKTVVVFSPPPRSKTEIGRCFMWATRFANGQLGRCDYLLEESWQRHARVYEFLRDVGMSYPVVWLDEGICADGRCRASREGVLLYRDNGHLSHEGSAYLGRLMDWPGLVRRSAVPKVLPQLP